MKSLLVRFGPPDKRNPPAKFPICTLGGRRIPPPLPLKACGNSESFTYVETFVYLKVNLEECLELCMAKLESVYADKVEHSFS